MDATPLEEMMPNNPLSREIEILAHEFCGAVFGLPRQDPVGLRSAKAEDLYESASISYRVGGKLITVGTLLDDVDPSFAYRWLATHRKNDSPEAPSLKAVDIRVGRGAIDPSGRIPGHLAAYGLGGYCALTPQLRPVNWIIAGDLEAVIRWCVAVAPVAGGCSTEVD